MKIRLPTRTEKNTFIIIDSMFPQKVPFGFRNIEINEYLKRVKGAKAYAMYPMKPWGDAWFPWSYGVEKDAYEDNVKGYLGHYPDNSRRVDYLDSKKTYRAQLAYSYFLAETYVLLPFYERNKIPFVFMLYPGGAFGLDNNASDKMLKRIFESKYFRGVIVSQQLTRDYLLEKNLCPENKIDLVFGGFSQFAKSEVRPKKYYKKDKETFDLVFVAGNYSKQGRDKGYDLFVEAAKKISATVKDARFHVVGNFSESDVPLGFTRKFFTFYGYCEPDFLVDLYASMDIYLSPNRPGELYEGNFDGFPLGIDTSFCGVAQFASNPLGMNKDVYTDGDDIVIVPLSAEGIAKKVIDYYDDLEKLYEVAQKGKIKAQMLFDSDKQVKERIQVFKKYAKIEETEV